MVRLSIFAGSILLLLAPACAPVYRLAMRPTTTVNQWAEGRELAIDQVDSVEVRLGFLCYEPARLVFEVEYRNTSRRPVLVAPEAIVYTPRRVAQPLPPDGRRPHPAPGVALTVLQTTSARQAALLPVLPVRPVPAFDPEPEIQELTERAKREAEKAARVDWLGLAFSLTSLVVDVTSIAKNETAAQVQSRVALQNAAVVYNVASAAARVEHAVAADVLQARAANLQEYALRKVTLAPGQQVRGYVYLPRFDTADGLLLRLPVRDEKAVNLSFTQMRQR